MYYDDPEPTTADEFNVLPYDTEWNGNKLEILWKDPEPITRKQLNMIERIVNHVYREKREEYGALASEERKKHILKDCTSIDTWLAQQYQHLNHIEGKTDEQSK